MLRSATGSPSAGASGRPCRRCRSSVGWLARREACAALGANSRRMPGLAETATQSLPLIRDLIGFPTVSRNPNRDLLDYVGAFLKKHGVAFDIIWNEDGRKGNLWATIGPADRRALMLSDRNDVAPDGHHCCSNHASILRPT